jgi:pyruvate,water dikinase
LWYSDIAPLVDESCDMGAAGANQGGGAVVFVPRRLKKLVGEDDANILLSGAGTDAAPLASLGPLLGLAKLAGGEIDKETFARQYGHRGPHEAELSIPRPGEDPNWIDAQLAALPQAKNDVRTLLASQAGARQTAWDRLVAYYPNKTEKVRRQITIWGKIARNREDTRSEGVRVMWVERAFALRAGEITGLGDNIFFLSIGEILALLGGDKTALSYIPTRRTTYERYCALPVYPTIIRGQFDPFQWAEDPERRCDVFEANQTHIAPESEAITGFPGAQGIVEGPARVILNAEDGSQLQAGEVLVTTLTNVGWTPIFSRASAIITDIGAPLSHAAIVARELGIPAVVGCGNATMCLHTGDLIRVNGGAGTVEILQPASQTNH